MINLEAVYVAFEMAALLGRLDPLNSTEVQRLPSAMARVIRRTLDEEISFPASDRKVVAPKPYDSIADLTRKYYEKYAEGSISYITFNYDLCLDFALFRQRFYVDYCLGAAPPGRNVKVLKLHGSLNWAKCEKCNLIVPYSVPDFLNRYRWDLFGGETAVKLSIATHFNSIKHCDTVLANEAFIAPPTWNKTLYHLQLESVWKAAAQELSEAENIVV